MAAQRESINAMSAVISLRCFMAASENSSAAGANGLTGRKHS